MSGELQEFTLKNDSQSECWKRLPQLFLIKGPPDEQYLHDRAGVKKKKKAENNTFEGLGFVVF